MPIYLVSWSTTLYVIYSTCWIVSKKTSMCIVLFFLYINVLCFVLSHKSKNQERTQKWWKSLHTLLRLCFAPSYSPSKPCPSPYKCLPIATNYLTTSLELARIDQTAIVSSPLFATVLPSKAIPTSRSVQAQTQSMACSSAEETSTEHLVQIVSMPQR